ncbi:hypothetical protein XaFJ1_GM001030 [Xanthomonas albilineans]|nr:hypothetical protein [Xanthomonas albilineans]QHQ27778.1 hypothetical protein XaFJ1_GM001030 [Xanthomonas albilineans]
MLIIDKTKVHPERFGRTRAQDLAIGQISPANPVGPSTTGMLTWQPNMHAAVLRRTTSQPIS